MVATVKKSADGASDGAKLQHAKNRVSVSCTSWPTNCTAIIEYSADNGIEVPWRQAYHDGSPVSVDATSEGVFDVDGGGYFRLNVSSFSGANPIVLAVLEIDQDNL